jgi:hypothetical protein
MWFFLVGLVGGRIIITSWKLFGSSARNYFSAVDFYSVLWVPTLIASDSISLCLLLIGAANVCDMVQDISTWSSNLQADRVEIRAGIAIDPSPDERHAFLLSLRRHRLRHTTCEAQEQRTLQK